MERRANGSRASIRWAGPAPDEADPTGGRHAFDADAAETPIFSTMRRTGWQPHPPQALPTQAFPSLRAVAPDPVDQFRHDPLTAPIPIVPALYAVDPDLGYGGPQADEPWGQVDRYAPVSVVPDHHQESYPADAYSADVYAVDAYAVDAYSVDAYSVDAYSVDAYSADAYSVDAYDPYPPYSSGPSSVPSHPAPPVHVHAPRQGRETYGSTGYEAVDEPVSHRLLVDDGPLYDTRFSAPVPYDRAFSDQAPYDPVTDTGRHHRLAPAGW